MFALILDTKKMTLQDLLKSWNSKLDRQATQYINLSKKITTTDKVLYEYFSLLQQVETSISDVFVISIF